MDVAETLAPMVPQPYRVRHRKRETADTVTLQLTNDGGPVPGFRPGQFAMVSAFGVGEVAISVSGDPSDRRTLVHTVRDVGPVTHRLCLTGRGGAVGVRGPFGTTWDLAGATGRDIVVVAGGVGLAPLRPVLFELRHQPSRYGRVSVLVGARSPAELLYAAQLGRWGTAGELDLHVTVDHALPGWRGHVGLVTDLLPLARFDPTRTFAFVCGPEVMMRLVAGELVDAGVAPEAVQVSLERNMKCGVGHCGHCQLGPLLLCRDGPVVGFDRAAPLLEVREL